MSKLNDRIKEFKDLLHDAGISCKKNKQSILDNTATLVKMLQSDLSAALKRAERAEALVERPSKARKLVESCAVAMVTGKLSGEIMLFSDEFVRLIGGHEDMSDLRSSSALFLARMGAEFTRHLSELRISKSKERILFHDTLHHTTNTSTTNASKASSMMKCRFVLRLCNATPGGTDEEFQCVLFPESEFEL